MAESIGANNMAENSNIVSFSINEVRTNVEYSKMNAIPPDPFTHTKPMESISNVNGMWDFPTASMHYENTHTHSICTDFKSMY